MISWIQRTFQHHFKLIFAILLVGMIIPFIFTIGSTPGVGRADRSNATQDYFGYNLLSQQTKARLEYEARLSIELQYSMANVSQEQLDNYMYQRIAAQHIADNLHLPQPTSSEITDFIKNLRMFAGTDGKFDVNQYDAFRNSLKTSGASSEDEIAHVISDDARMFKVGRLIAGPGYVVPSDVAGVLKRADTTWTISTATIDYGTFAAGLMPTDAEVAKYFADNSLRYTIAPKVEVEAVQFPASAHFADMKPTQDQIRSLYDSNPARFPRPAPPKGAPQAKPDPAADFAAAEPQVRAALVQQMAQQAAVKEASDLAYSVYDGKVTREGIDAFLASKKLSSRTLAPFTEDEGPKELPGAGAIAKSAFELGADQFYSEAIPTPDGAVVLFWKNSIASRQPLLAEVKDKVREDATDSMRRQRFVEFGRSLQSSVERRVRAGEAFDKAVAESAGAVKVEVKSLPPFSLKAPPKDLDPAAEGALDGLQKGQVSPMQATADKGVLVYAANEKAPPTDESNPLYGTVRTSLAARYAAADETSIMREYVDGELRKAGLTSDKK